MPCLALTKCNVCGVEKPETEFYKNHKAHRNYTCSACMAIRQREWRKQKPGLYHKHDRERRIRKSYGYTGIQYDEQFKKQNGCCAICGKPETHKKNGIIMPLSIDHNHVTGRVRELLCHKCNSGIGFLNVDKDGIDLLLAAISYVKKYE
jgi:hypothetical protein